MLLEHALQQRAHIGNFLVGVLIVSFFAAETLLEKLELLLRFRCIAVIEQCDGEVQMENMVAELHLDRLSTTISSCVQTDHFTMHHVKPNQFPRTINSDSPNSRWREI